MSGQGLTASERETVILLADDSDLAIVTTWQRPVITRLMANPAAELVWERRVGSSRGAQFRLPAEFVSFRSKRRSGGSGNPEALRRVA